MSFVIFILAVIAVEAISEIITSSDIFIGLRAWFSRQENFVLNFISRMITCGYCCSVWVSGALAWSIPLQLTEYWFVDLVVKIFAVHRLSNWYHEFMARWQGRHPWTFVNMKVGK